MLRDFIWISTLVFLFANGVIACRSEQTYNPPTPVENEQTAPPELPTLSSPLHSPISPIVPASSPTPIILPTPDKGKATIGGRLIINDGQGTPLRETALYLTPGVGENGDELPPLLVGVKEGDIRGFTDKQGAFIISDVPPGKYYLIIWAPLSWIAFHEIHENQLYPILLELQPDQTVDLGDRVINWP